MMARADCKAKKGPAQQPSAEPTARLMAPHELLLASPVQGAIGIQAWGKFAGEADLVGLLKGIREENARVLGGDMHPIETMLFGQAKVLETIATCLIRRAAGQEQLKQFQAHLTLALKAQAQCRATLEALAEIKNPRQVLISRQTNIAGGHQQVVNSGPSEEMRPVRTGARAPAEQTESLKNELLEGLSDEVAVGCHRHEHAGQDRSHVQHSG